MYAEFKGEGDWEIFYEELKKVGLTSSDIGRKKELGVKLASGIKGNEYATILAEYVDLNKKIRKSALMAGAIILEKRAREAEL
jgi:hypothetical protein